MYSFHKTTQDQVQSVDVGTNDQRTLDEQRQLVAKQTDSEGANVTKSVDSTATEDGHVPCGINAETQLSNSEEERVESAPDQETPEQRPAVITSVQFLADVGGSDSQGNSFVSLSMVDATSESNLLSPFVPKKKSMEEKRPISDLIQFGDNTEPNVNKLDTAAEPKDSLGNVTPFEDVGLTEEANQTKGIERSLSNVRQPSMESDHSVVCDHCQYYLTTGYYLYILGNKD